MRSRKLYLAKFVFAIAASLFALPQSDGQEIQKSYRPLPGRPHPDFVLPAIDDQRPVSLSDYRGKKLVLIHFASW